MRPNKILGLAITSALITSTNLSFAGEIEVEYVDANCVKKSGPATLASELFSTDNLIVPIPSVCSSADDLDNSGENGPVLLDGTYDDKWLYAKYIFDTTRDETPFLARFELSNGAQFGKDISLGNGTNLDFVAHPSGSHAGVTKSSALGGGGSAGDTQVVFYITPKQGYGFTNNQWDTLFLRFNLKNLGVLKTPGEEVKLTTEVFADSNQSSSFDGGPVTESVVTSARAIINPTTGTVQIDTAEECTTFTGNGTAFIDSTKVKLGSIFIQSPSNVLKADLSEWKFDLDTISSLSPNNLGILTITDGTFSASTTPPGKVFLDLNGDHVFTSGTDISTTTVISNTNS